MVLLFFLLLSLSFLRRNPLAQPTPTPGFSASQLSGRPKIFLVTDFSQFDPYRLISKYKQTFLLDEYVIYGGGVNSSGFVGRMIVYDPTIQDIVDQNLMKELYYTFFVSSGLLPSATYTNTTISISKDFSPFTDKTSITFDITFSVEAKSARDIFPPVDFDLEIGSSTRNIRTRKTFLHYQSVSILRWRLSDEAPVTWYDIQATAQSLQPSFPNGTANWTVTPSDFQRVDCPCIKDMFMAVLIVGDKNSSSQHIYADMPAFHMFGDDELPIFTNLTASFCPNEKRKVKSVEECGYVQQIVLTNNRIVALTDKGLYVSASLRESPAKVSLHLQEKPLLSYELRDPCEKFDKYLSCFKQGQSSLSLQLLHSIRLFYIPVCFEYQFPFYEDRLMVVVEHTLATGNVPPTRAFSILYASVPYTDWKALFIGESKYEDSEILEVTSIFFNNHLRLFDITLKIKNQNQKKRQTTFVRFVLPDPKEDEDQTEIKIPYPELNGLLGRGFIPFVFPPSTDIKNVMVTPNSLDVFWIGNQLWIAEGGHSLVYRSISGLSDNSYIRTCHFNHPDRFFVCTNSLNTVILVGRLATKYSPTRINVMSVEELWEAAGINGGYWPPDYLDYVLSTALYTVSYKGSVLLWFLHDDQYLHKKHQELVAAAGPAGCTVAVPQLYERLRPVCQQLLQIAATGLPFPLPSIAGPYFRMISINPHNLTRVTEPLDGPLTPVFLESQSILLYEGSLGGGMGEFRYISESYTGRNIDCDTNYAYSNSKTDKCKLHIRFIKPLQDRFLQGFRQVVFTTVLQPLPLETIPSEYCVLRKANSNKAFIVMTDFQFPFDPVPANFNANLLGWTWFIPGNFSILISGFGYEHQAGGPFVPNRNVMWGYATESASSQQTFCATNYTAFLLNLSSSKFRMRRLEIIGNAPSRDESDWREFFREEQAKQRRDQEREDSLFRIKLKIQQDYDANPYAKYNALAMGPNSLKLFTQTQATVIPLFDPIEILSQAADAALGKPKGRWVPTPLDIDPQKLQASWIVQDGGCQLALRLQTNEVLKSHGGRIHIDLHEAISYQVVIRAITQLGQLTLYRPLFTITNSNPAILNIDRTEKYDRNEGARISDIILSGTGAGIGLASVVIRSISRSLKCETPLSITLLVQVHRQEGRRLRVTYPVPICNNETTSPYYLENHPHCVNRSTILKAGDTEDGKIERDGTTIFRKLPPNYRPPSAKGEQIPTSLYTYNADPQKPDYNNWYEVTNNSRRLRKCSFKANRSECDCSEDDVISDDPNLSDCTQMVFVIRRGTQFNISFDYDPVMANKNQIQEFFTPKEHLSVYLEEVNNRTEFTLYSPPTDILNAINADENLNQKHTFYNAKGISITLHGTGLFHFKAVVGQFDSFQEVSGYFMVYSDTNELNHIKLVVVMLLTITFCFALVFLGFVRARKRLASQLPFQTLSKPGKIKAE